MAKAEHRERRPRRPPKPLDRARLEDLALGYVARFATTAAKLRTYLRRKLRERGWDGEEAPDIDGLIARFIDRKYVDDAVYARGKSDSLLRRGYGARRIAQALHHAGVDEGLRDSLAPDDYARREAALALARRRRFGPFARERFDHATREKQVGALLRAGHSYAMAREVLELGDEEAAHEWLDAARERGC